MWRVFWSVAAMVAVFAGMVAWASSSATFLFHHPRTEGLRVVIDRATGAAVVEQYANSSAQIAQPQAQAAQTEFDFGFMDPLTMGKHEFVIENVGQVPLKLSVGPTSCKCAVGGLDKREVAPGEKAAVTLEWNTGRSPHYAHTARIFTNDPLHKALDFWVSGKVRMRLSADVPAIVLSDVRPNESAVAECFVYSQVWDDLEIQSVDSQLKGLAWTAVAVAPDQAPNLSASSLKLLRVTIPPEGLSRQFSDTLRIQVKVPSEDSPPALELPIHGNVLGSYTVYGSQVADDAVVLGSVPEGQGARCKLLLKIRDAEPAIGQPRIEVAPSQLQVRVTPHQEGGARGLYDVFVELPADAPVCQFLGTPEGKVTIHTDHPRIKQIEFPVRFAVVPRRND